MALFDPGISVLLLPLASNSFCLFDVIVDVSLNALLHVLHLISYTALYLLLNFLALGFSLAPFNLLFFVDLVSFDFG